MTLFDLFTANEEWDTNTELYISYNHLGDIKWDSGQALDIIYKYEKFEVLSFYKNSLFLREQEKPKRPNGRNALMGVTHKVCKTRGEKTKWIFIIYTC